jgi:cytochrome c peroxidase
MGKSNKGLSAELDAMAAYTNTHRFPLSPHAKTGLSEAARRGRDLFFSAQTGCATCHSGPYFTDSQPASKPIVHDVGTGSDDPTEKMGPLYDTPTLLGVYKTAPYLHHGKAATLRDVLTSANAGDRHGKTSHLTAAQIDDLVEFLKALPYEDPEPRAIESKLIKVEK